MAGLYVIVAGAGKVGWNLARELMDTGHEVTLIEQFDLNTKASGSNAGSIHAQLIHALLLNQR